MRQPRWNPGRAKTQRLSARCARRSEEAGHRRAKDPIGHHARTHVSLDDLSDCQLPGGGRASLLDEWAYVRPYSSNAKRTEALADFLHTYNYHRCHTALGGQPPTSRVNKAADQYT